MPQILGATNTKYQVCTKAKLVFVPSQFWCLKMRRVGRYNCHIAWSCKIFLSATRSSESKQRWFIFTGKSCHDPGTPWKGRKIGELQIGETLYFSCPPCHQLRGSATRTCLSNLTWSGHQPTCTGKFCDFSFLEIRFSIENRRTIAILRPNTPVLRQRGFHSHWIVYLFSG
jgi:hypothetical protein